MRAQNGVELYAKTRAYDDRGRVARETHVFPAKTFLLDFAYDELGRPTTLTYPDTATVVRYEYAGPGLEKVCEVTSPAQGCAAATATYVSDVAYDTLGRRAKVTTPAGERSYTYTPTTQRLLSDTFDGVTPGGYTRDLDYALDPLGNPLAITGTSSTNEVDYSASYTYDGRNRLASWEKPGVPSGSGTPIVPPTPTAYFTYSALGNLTGHAVASPPDVNQQFSATRPHAVTARTDLNRTYSYDLDGNLLSETWTGGARHYSFDTLNRLVCVGTAAGFCNTLAVDYDAAGARVKEQYTSPAGASIARRYAGELFTLDNDRGDFHIFAFGETIGYKRQVPVTLRTAGGFAGPWPLPGAPAPWVVIVFAGAGALGLVRLAFARAPGLREEPALGTLALVLVAALVLPPLPARAGGGSTNVSYRRWILADPLGSATVVLDDTGTAKRETVYAPFGALHQDEGSHDTDTEIFAGHPRESTSGLHYMRARWQNPTTGSFVSVDPIVGDAADPQAFNGYAYARNNPVTYTDPTGMCGEFGCGWWGSGSGGGVYVGDILTGPLSTGGGGGSTSGFGEEPRSQGQPIVLAQQQGPFTPEDDVEGLDPVFKDRLGRVLERLRDQGWKPRVADGLRTPEEQRKKIEERRSKPGSDDPNGRNPSPHLFGRGGDVVDRRWGYGAPAQSHSFPFWRALGEAARAEGLRWGGTLGDPSHIYLPGR